MLIVRVLQSNPYDSLKLHFLNQLMNQSTNVQEVQILMGTPTNKNYLSELDIQHPLLQSANSSNLMIVAKAGNENIVDEIIQQAEKLIQDFLVTSDSKRDLNPSETSAREYALTQKEVISPFFFRDVMDSRRMGRIHSIFQSSFNIQIDEDLFNFSTKGMPLAPHGCVLEKEIIDPLLLHSRVGDIVRLEDKKFTFYTRGHSFRLDLANLDIFELAIPRVNSMIENVRKTAIYQQLDAIPFEKYIGLRSDVIVRKNMEVLEKVSSFDEEQTIETISYLIGRGDGLTPSGDDILLGYTMVRQVFIPIDSFIDLLFQELKKTNTTAISQAYYDGLFAGYVNSLFHTLLSLIDSDSNEVIKNLISLITRYGHTSGYDTLYGCYLGLRSLKSDN